MESFAMTIEIITLAVAWSGTAVALLRTRPAAVLVRHSTQPRSRK
jgi:hypothetical protein